MKKYYVDKVRSINCEKVDIRVLLDEKEFENIYEKKFSDETNYDFIKPKHANEWLEKYVTGCITKDALD